MKLLVSITYFSQMVIKVRFAAHLENNFNYFLLALHFNSLLPVNLYTVFQTSNHKECSRISAKSFTLPVVHSLLLNLRSLLPQCEKRKRKTAAAAIDISDNEI